jgi:hypothetical protein
MLKQFFRRFSVLVDISYPTLVADGDLSGKIAEAYGPDGYGVLKISDIPGFKKKREGCLRLASKLAKLSPEALAKIEVPETSYGIGWSHGKEVYFGKPDYSKGSFYANPEYDDAVKHENGYYRNAWPSEDLPELEPAFKTLSQEICRIGYLLAAQIDSCIKTHNPEYSEGLYLNSLKNSGMNFARLLHYFPK